MCHRRRTRNPVRRPRADPAGTHGPCRIPCPGGRQALRSQSSLSHGGREREAGGAGLPRRHSPASPVPGLEDAIAVSTGYEHNLALKKDGTVWGWGHNYFHQLGFLPAELYNPYPTQEATGINNATNINAINVSLFMIPQMSGVRDSRYKSDESHQA